MTTELTVIQNQLAIFDVKEAVLGEFKKAESLKCKDANSRKVLGKYRADAKSLRVKIEDSRLDKNRKVLAKNNKAATAIKDRLTESIDAYDAEIKPFDQIAKDKKAAKEKAKAERVAKITEKIDDLKSICAAAIGCNISSEHIKQLIINLEAYAIDDSFHDFKSQAEMTKIGGIESAKQALEVRKEREAQQAENERIRLENEANAKAIAEKEELNRRVEDWFDTQRFTFSDCQKARDMSIYESTIELFKEMVVPDFIVDRKDEAIQKIAESITNLTELMDGHKQSIDDENKRKAGIRKLAADRQKLEDEKAAIQAEKDRMEAESEERSREVKKQDQIAKWSDYAEGLNQEYHRKVQEEADRKAKEEEAARIEKLAAEEKRAALIEADKGEILDTVKKIDDFISGVGFPITRTDEAAEIESQFFRDISTAVENLELSLTELK